MSSQKWSAELAKKLVKCDVASIREIEFREDYAQRLEHAKKNGKLTQLGFEILSDLPKAVVRWNEAEALKPETVLKEWESCYSEAEKEKLPDELLSALVSQFPEEAGKAVDWSPLLLRFERLSTLHALHARGFVKKAALIEMAKQQPEEFYASPALDVLVEMRARVPESVWDPLVRGEARPIRRGGKSGEQALAEALEKESSPGPYRWLQSALSLASDEVGERIFAEILRFPKVVVRFLMTSAQDRTGIRSEKKLRQFDDEAGPTGLLLLKAAERAATQDPANTIWQLLALFESLSGWCEEALPPIVRKEAAALSGRTGKALSLAALRKAESEEGGSKISRSILVPADTLYDTVQQYLEELPTTGSDDANPNRTARMAELRGSLTVIRALLDACMDVGASPESETISIALYNVGVREFGEEGDTVGYDPERHRSDIALPPGEEVTLLVPGQRIGDEEMGMVVVKKARVGPAH